MNLNSVDIEGVLSLFDHLPDIYFFVKDGSGKFLHVNQALLGRLGLSDASEMVGTSDYQRYPKHLADQLARDDQRIMASGQPLTDYVEPLLDATGQLNWYATTKLPLRDRRGRIVGVFGMVRAFDTSRRLLAAYGSVTEIVELIRADPAEKHRVPDLAKRAGVSPRQLNRRFHDALGMSLQEFLLRNRIQAAAVELRSGGDPIATIALRYGFFDQSAFTRQFRKQLGVTPSKYRRVDLP